MCITLLFLLKHIPSMGSRYFDLRLYKAAASLKISSMILCCTILK